MLGPKMAVQQLLWRFIPSSSEPAPEPPVEEKRKQKAVEYEKNKRVRKFIKAWQIDREWLQDGPNGMTCSTCIDHGSEVSVFVEGCKTYKIDSIVKHAASESHKRATLIWKAKAAPIHTSEAAKCIQLLNEETFNKLDKIFRICHALVKHNRPLSDFIWMCQLGESQGLEIGETYQTRFSATNFVNAIAEVEFGNISDQIKQANFLCIIGDGSTDSAVTEQEMWFVRTCTNGQIAANFIGVESAEKASAENIVKGLRNTVNRNLHIEWAEFTSKLICIACDGASVMVGCRSGVGALLRQYQPSLITIHCMAHRLELALKDAVKKLRLYDKTVCVLAMGLYYFYHNSALNRAMLKRSRDMLKSDGDAALLLPTRVGGTRWIGHTFRALTNLTSSYKYIVAHLGQLTEPVERVSVDSKAKAKAFLQLLTNKSVVYFMFFLLDVLTPLKRLSLHLQDRSCVVANQHTLLDSVMELIKQCKSSDGPYLRKAISGDQFQTLKGNDMEFAAARNNFVDAITGTLQARFEDFSSPTVIRSTRIADIKTWPRSWDILKEYGNEDLAVLTNHFRSQIEAAGYSCEEAEMEWLILKKTLHDEGELEKMPDWMSIHQRFSSNNCKNILAVIDLIHTLSASSAEAERGFSQLKLIKTDRRSRLTSSTLNNCLGIKFLAKDMPSFNPTEAIHHWNSSGERSRRPLTMEKKTARSLIDLTSEAEVSSESEPLNSVEETEPAFELSKDVFEFNKEVDDDYEYDDADGLDEVTVLSKLFSLAEDIGRE